MRILLVSAIFPPDIGGPATHTADLAVELRARGHDVTVLTLVDGVTRVDGDGVVRFPRLSAWPVRNARALRWIIQHGREFDVIYATGLTPVAVAGAAITRLPVVVKIVGDPAWERGTRRGVTAEPFEGFQHARGGRPSVRAMRWLRNWSVRHASAVITPSDHLRSVVESWGARDVTVVRNGVRRSNANPRYVRQTHSVLDLIYVGRLVAHKQVDVLISAIADTQAARLDVIGAGPEIKDLQRQSHALGAGDRVRFLGALDHDAVMQRLACADALVLASSYEGLPHVALEALVSGTPVVAPAVGGMMEALHDGVDGIVLADASARSFIDAIERLVDDPALLERLRAGARTNGEKWTFDHCVDRIELLLQKLSTRAGRAVFLGKTCAPTPLPSDQRKKYALHDRHLRTFAVGTGRLGATRAGLTTIITLPDLRGALGTCVFYVVGPVIALALAAARDSTAIVCQSPYEAVGVLTFRRLLPRRARPPVQVELHGDWRTATRLYGSSKRRVVANASDRAAVWALRRADRVRVVSRFLCELARDAGYEGPIDRFLAFSEYDTFLDPAPVPPPVVPHVLFVGVLERYKGVDVLLDAWCRVLAAMPDATLTIVGAGSRDEDLRDQAVRCGFGDGVRFLAPVPRAVLCDLLDASSLLVLPSRSEGLGRIVLEAMARARPVVGSRVGGIVEVVDDGVTGRTVAPTDPNALADAIIEVLSHNERAHLMGLEARARVATRDPVAEYEAGIERLAGWLRGTE